MQRRWLVAVAMVESACSDPLAPGAGDDAGSGTGTLHVTGHVVGSSNGASLSAAFGFDISKGGVPVTDARVTITSRAGRHVLGSDVRFPGRWSRIVDGYEQVYVLDVESGDDAIHDVRVDGPSPIVFTSPAESSTIDPASPLEIRWEPSTADQTSMVINPQSTSLGNIDDDGSFTIPPNTFANPDGWYAIGLRRTSSVTPAGASEGSRMTVETDNYLHVCDRRLPICTD